MRPIRIFTRFLLFFWVTLICFLLIQQIVTYSHCLCICDGSFPRTRASLCSCWCLLSHLLLRFDMCHGLFICQSFLYPCWGNEVLSLIWFYILVYSLFICLYCSFEIHLLLLFDVPWVCLFCQPWDMHGACKFLAKATLRAMCSPVGVLLFSYLRGGGSSIHSGSGKAHFAICGSSFPGLLSYVGQSLNPALLVPCLIRFIVIWHYLQLGFTWHLLPKPLSDWPLEEKCPHWEQYSTPL